MMLVILSPSLRGTTSFSQPAASGPQHGAALWRQRSTLPPWSGRIQRIYGRDGHRNRRNKAYSFSLLSLSAQSSSSREDEGETWEKVSDIGTFESPWLKLIGERLKDNQGRMLDYWRVQKDDSAVIVTLHRDQLIFPKPMYRPGLGTATLDFPGGRVPAAAVPPMDVVRGILKRELGIDETDLEDLRSLNAHNGWPVNSSFSNQKLFGFVAKIKSNVDIDPKYLHSKRYSTTSTNDMAQLLESDLTCLQCRSVLLEWLRRQPKYG